MPPLSCTVCTLEQSSVGVLHYHQMCLHTTEELSLALLSLQGLTDFDTKTSTSTGESSDENSLLRRALTKYPRFLTKQQERKCETVDKGIQTKVDEEIQCETDDEVVDIETITEDETGNKIKKKSVKSNIFTKAYLKRKILNKAIQKKIIRRISEAELEESSEELNFDLPLQMTCADTDNSVDNSSLSATPLRLRISEVYSAGTSTDSSPMQATRMSKRKCKKPKKFCPDDDDDVTVKIKQRNESTPIRKRSTSTESLKNYSILSPARKTKHQVQALITNIPGIFSLNGKNKSRSEFLIPSPVTERHRSSVTYDYSAVKIKEENDSDDYDEFHEGVLLIDESFEPQCDLYVPDDEVNDAACATDVNEVTDKSCGTECDPSVDIGTQIGSPFKRTPIRREAIVQTSDIEYDEPTKKRIRKKFKRWTTTKATKRKAGEQSRQKSPVQSTSKAYNEPVKDEGFNNEEFINLGYVPVPNTNMLQPIVLQQRRVADMIIHPHPNMDDSKRFSCDVCYKVYKKKSHLERHLRNHTGERPYICDYCPKTFAVRSVLKQHIRIHTGERPFACSVCGQRFPQKSGLMTHMMLHTGKPFKCDRCDKAFVSNHKLVNHLNSHNGERPHSCSACGARFFTEYTLNEHLKIHNRERTFMCSFCSSSFIHEVYLKVHLEEHIKTSRMKQEALSVPSPLNTVLVDFREASPHAETENYNIGSPMIETEEYNHGSPPMKVDLERASPPVDIETAEIDGLNNTIATTG